MGQFWDIILTSTIIIYVSQLFTADCLTQVCTAYGLSYVWKTKALHHTVGYCRLLQYISD
jgi:hypothetical protein